MSATETVPAPVLPAGSSVSTTATGVSFRNSRAVWITIVTAAVTLVAMPILGLLFAPLSPIVLCAAGFFATRLYNQKASQPLNAAGAARLGWMTGLWLFVAVALLFALLALVVSDADTWSQLQAAWRQIPQASKLVSMSQHDILMQMLIELPIAFFLFTLLPGLGGILGAKFPRRRSS